MKRAVATCLSATLLAVGPPVAAQLDDDPFSRPAQSESAEGAAVGSLVVLDLLFVMGGGVWAATTTAGKIRGGVRPDDTVRKGTFAAAGLNLAAGALFAGFAVHCTDAACTIPWPGHASLAALHGAVAAVGFTLAAIGQNLDTVHVTRAGVAPLLAPGRGGGATVGLDGW